MRQLKKNRFVCLDVEATGLDCEKDRVIEVAAVQFSLDENFVELESLIDPEQEIPESSIAIHHISQDMVQGKPKIAEILPEFLSFVGDSTIVGHGIGFDIEILTQEAKRVNVPCSLSSNKTVDTLRLARLYGQSPSNSLDVLRRHFNIEAEGAHRALNDVVVNIQVFRYLVHTFNSLKEIEETLAKPIFMKNMPLGKHKGRSLKEIPIDYLKWASFQKFDRDLIFSLRKEISRRKKGATFQNASNPFHAL